MEGLSGIGSNPIYDEDTRNCVGAHALVVMGQVTGCPLPLDVESLLALFSVKFASAQGKQEPNR